MKVLLQFLPLLWLTACQGPPPDAQRSADGRRWVHLEALAPDPAKEQLLPTQRLVLHGPWWQRPLVLVEDLENLCGFQVRWLDDERLFFQAPLAKEKRVLIRDGQTWGPVQLKVAYQSDALRFDRYSKDWLRRLVVLENCERTLWNLYLRKPGEALYNDAMEAGWDDPSVFGGLGRDQAPESLEWVAPRRARIVIPGRKPAVTLREKIEDVTLEWVFTKKDAKAEEERGQDLKVIEYIPATVPSIPNF